MMSDPSQAITKAFNRRDKEEVVRLLNQVQQQNLLKDDGYRFGLVNWAAAKGWLEVVKLLVDEYYCDPNDSTNPMLLRSIHIPVHAACSNGHIDVVRYFIEECNCDPMCTIKDSDRTLFHKACAGGQLQIFLYLIIQCNCDPLGRDNEFNSPLYIASASGQLEIIKYLIANFNCDPNDNNNQLGCTPLHAACSNGHIDVIRYFIKVCKCDPMSKRKDGNMTTLHAACASGHLNIVKYLITQCNCDPNFHCNFFNTPLHEAVRNNHYNVAEYLVCTGKVDPFIGILSPNSRSNDEPIRRLFIKFSQLKSCTRIDSYMNMFLLGSSGVGKTTLTQVIKKRANGVILGKYRSISTVELHTAGIIPCTLEHKELGNIVLHDLAGQPEYYSSHSAIMENILSVSAGVFIIVAKLSDDPPYKWLNLVKNLSSKCSGMCHVLTVASYKDRVKYTDRKRCEQQLKQKIELFLQAEKNLRHIGIVSLDCRRLDGEAFSVFVSKLYSACVSVRNKTMMIFQNLDSKDLIYCHMLYKLLKSKNEDVYFFDSLFKMIKKCKDLYLPETQEKLQEILHNLHRTGLVLFIKCSSGLWIVVKKHSLLTEVNGKMFSPFQKNQRDAIVSNTGIVSEEMITQHFPMYDSQMLIEFLVSMKLCEKTTPDLIQWTNLTVNDSDSNSNTLLFFPALMTLTQRPVMSSDVFLFGWCLQCTNPYQDFTPRFLHLLILRLAYLPELLKAQDNPHDRRCTLWSTGIMWCSRLGITTLVELVDDSKCVILLMSSQEGLQHNMIPIRRTVISDILSLQQEYCPSVRPKEFVINPSQLHYPIDNLSGLVLYDLEGIATAAVHNEPCVTSCNKSNDLIKFCELFPFEHDKGKDMSIFTGRDLKNIKLPGGKTFPDIVLPSISAASCPCSVENIVSIPFDGTNKPTVQNEIASTPEQNRNQISFFNEEWEGDKNIPNIASLEGIIYHQNLPINVLKKHSVNISKIISIPESFANHLHSKNLISDEVMDEVLTTLGLSRLRKTLIILNEVQHNFTSGDQLLKFNILCETMIEYDSTGVMREIVRRMERDVETTEDEIL